MGAMGAERLIMVIEIFERASGDVVERKTTNNLRGFLMYWSMQCDSKEYGYRILEESEV